jgi:recombination protein RecA
VEDERPCLGIIINQWREKIGVMHGDPRTTPGGKAKNFAYFTRVEMARQDWIEVGSNKVGITTKAKTLKNKTAAPQRTGVVDFYFEDTPGFSKGSYDVVKEVANIALTLDIVKRTGAYYLFANEKWHGKEEFYAALRSEVDLREQIDAEVRKLILHE